MNFHDAAWAAGLFDGDGSAWGYVPRRRRSRAVQMAVYQSSPSALERFRAVVGAGNIHGPYRQRLYHWTTKRISAIEATCTVIWPALSDEKRTQLQRAFLGSERYMTLAERLGAGRPRREWSVELAWAAGFFDAEGSVIAPRGGAGVPTLEVPQSTASGAIPPVLERFRQAVLGVGHVYGPRAPRGWSKLPQYRWQIRSFEGTQAVVALLWPWLGVTKRTEAASALRAYLARNAQRGSSVRLHR